jgi:hypothetical protein
MMKKLDIKLAVIGPATSAGIGRRPSAVKDIFLPHHKTVPTPIHHPRLLHKGRLEYHRGLR